MKSDSHVDQESPISAIPVSAIPADLHHAIRCRAEEIYIRSGCIPGRDLENWAEAEKEILRESGRLSAHNAAIVVAVNGGKYVGEYSPASSGGYKPGEFEAGARLTIRFDGDKMFVRRPNGQELETTLVRASDN